MNDEPRQVLRKIIERHGRSVVENARKCEALLRDHCGEFRREIAVLSMALEEGVVADMLGSSTAVPRKVLLNRLAQRLCDNLALSEAAAHWSVGAWAWALGLISDAEFDAQSAQAASASSLVAATTSQQGTTATRQPAASSAVAPVTSMPRPAASTAGPVFVVAPHGGNFSSIADAVKRVPSNSRLLVREGLYTESVEIDRNVEIVGDGPRERIVIRSTDRSCIAMRTEKASVRGLTLQGRGKASGRAFFAVDISMGTLVLEGCDVSSDSLSCVAIYGTSTNPHLKNCSIHDGADSGIYVFDNARGLIENCEVHRNANVNVAVTAGANPTIRDCRVFEGRNGGVVVWGNGATAIVEDCQIHGHRFANVGVREAANPIFRRCTIFNSADSGVLVQESAYGTFEECDVHNNAKVEIAVTDGSNTILRRCNVHHGNETGIFVRDRARALVESCNVYENDDAGIAVHNESVAAVRGCNVLRNGTVAVRVKGGSAASVEDCDLRGNRVATWETEYGVFVERRSNREQ